MWYSCSTDLVVITSFMLFAFFGLHYYWSLCLLLLFLVVAIWPICFFQLMGNSYDLSLKGSPYWMAPEVFYHSNNLFCSNDMPLLTIVCPLKVVKGAIKNESNLDVVTGIDIWSLGCTIIEMFTGKPPWSEAEWVSTSLFLLTHFSQALRMLTIGSI